MALVLLVFWITLSVFKVRIVDLDHMICNLARWSDERLKQTLVFLFHMTHNSGLCLKSFLTDIALKDLFYLLIELRLVRLLANILKGFLLLLDLRLWSLELHLVCFWIRMSIFNVLKNARFLEKEFSAWRLVVCDKVTIEQMVRLVLMLSDIVHCSSVSVREGNWTLRAPELFA